MNRYVDTLTDNLVTVGWAAKQYKLSGARYPLLPGVIVYCNLAVYTPVVATEDQVLLNTATLIGDEWVQDVRAKTAVELLSDEISWVAGEMAWADKEMGKHTDGHSRLKGSIQDMKNFRNALRDYIRDSDTDIPYIDGAKPTTRPGA